MSFDLNILLDLLEKDAAELARVAADIRSNSDVVGEHIWKPRLAYAIGDVIAMAAFTAEVAGVSDEDILTRGEEKTEALDNKFPGLVQ